VFTNANPPVHKLGQGALQDDLQTLVYDLDDMYRPSHMYRAEEVKRG
jgi:hypothetical protein